MENQIEGTTTFAIEAMKNEGWQLHSPASTLEHYIHEELDILIFSRKPNQKPNAIVDFKALEALKKKWPCSAIEQIEKLIKKT